MEYQFVINVENEMRKWILSALNIVMIIGLGILSVLDIKSRRIPIWFVGVFSIVCFLLRLIEEISLWELVLGVIPGIVLLIVAVWSKEKIGIGDAFVVCILGIGYSVKTVISIVGISFFLIAICSFNKAKQRYLIT